MTTSPTIITYLLASDRGITVAFAWSVLAVCAVCAGIVVRAAFDLGRRRK